jgi:hypothetical protein
LLKSKEEIVDRHNMIKELSKEDQEYLLSLKHKYHMEEMEYQRETERLKNEWEKERMRIKSAEIRKSQERRDNRNWIENNGK